MQESTLRLDVDFVPVRPYFVAGDVIKGNLVLTTTRMVVIGCVNAEVICKAQAFDIVYKSGHPGRGEDAEYVREQIIHHPLTHQYLTTSPLVVFDARSTGGMSLSSTLMRTIAFQFPVKVELPSTVTERNGQSRCVDVPMSVSYEMKLTTLGITGRVLNMKSFFLDIRTLFHYPSPEKPLKASRSEVTCSCWPSEAFTFYCVTDRTVYGPGDRIKLSYWYDAKNRMSHPAVTSVIIRVLLNFKCERPSKWLDEKHFPAQHISSIANYRGIVPSIGDVIQCFIDVPMNVFPDCTLNGPEHCLCIKHNLTITVGVNSTRTYDVLVPVVFNSLCAADLAQFPHSVMEKSLPQSTVQAQEFYESHPNPPALTASPSAPVYPVGAYSYPAPVAPIMAYIPVASPPMPVTTVGYVQVPTARM